MLAAALEANRQLAGLAERQRAEIAELRELNARLVERDAEREAELEEARAALAVLQRMVFGRSSEKSRPGPSGGDEGSAGDGGAGKPGDGKDVKRGLGARAGRRDYSHLPRFTVIWDFPGGGYCCPECGEPFTPLGDHWSGEQLDWQVTVRVAAHCRKRYKRACGCRVPATVTAPGPPKAVGKGLFSNGFIAMLLTERFAAGRSMNSLVTGLARHGAEISPATLAGTCAQAGTLLAPLAGAIAERNRDSWHLHADETTWRVFAPRDGDGPAKWWLWVFIGPDTVCFVMDPSRSGQVLARHAGIDEETGQLTAGGDGGPRRLVISSDFYKVYESAGKKTDGLVNLYCWAHVRRHFVRAGDANPVQLKYWTDKWLDRIRDLYAAHGELMAAWQEQAAPAPQEKQDAAARLERAYAGWDDAIRVIDETRKTQAQAPGLQEPAKKALATLDREWDGLIAHRDYPMASLDNNIAERTIRGPVVTRKNAGGSRNGDTARTAAAIWTVTATVQMAGLNIITFLTAYLDECGRNGGKPLSGPTLERFLPWNASPEDHRTWAQPPPGG
jgi:transposase